MVAAAAAAAAVAAVAAGQNLAAHTNLSARGVALAAGTGSARIPSAAVRQPSPAADPGAGAGAVQAPRPLYVLPAVGPFTSGFGFRWGTMHNGDDIANAMGTPIGSVTDGVVIEAGPASGFGLWVRVHNDDGTIAVYGHVHEILAKVGQRVLAGQEIATIGNRGGSTGPHLHFEIWVNDKDKIDPQPWLASHGLILK